MIKAISARRNIKGKDIEEFDHVLSRIFRSFEKEYKVSLLSVQPQGKLLSSLFDEYNKSSYSKEHSNRRCAIVIDNSKQTLITPSTLNQNQKLFLSKLSNLCKAYSHSNRVVLNKHKRNVNQGNRDGIEYSIGKSNDDNLLSYADLFKRDFPWEQMRFKNYSKQHLREYFTKLVIDEASYNSFLKAERRQLNKDELKKRVEIIQENGEKTVREFEEDTNLYCYCKQRYSQGDMMICCEKGFECIGSHEGWYHIQCIDEIKNMPQREIDSFKFICIHCKKRD